MEVDATRRVNLETGKLWQGIGDHRVPIYHSTAERREAERRGKLHKPSRRFTIRLPSDRK